jgi:hypothetical protein
MQDTASKVSKYRAMAAEFEAITMKTSDPRLAQSYQAVAESCRALARLLERQLASSKDESPTMPESRGSAGSVQEPQARDYVINDNGVYG